MDEKTGTKSMGEVIQIDEARIRDHLGAMVRDTVEEALNAMLDAEADRLCGAGRYERTQLHDGCRAWKSFDWGATDRLYRKGFICDPANKAKSVVLTDEGLQKSEELFKALFTRKP